MENKINSSFVKIPWIAITFVLTLIFSIFSILLVDVCGELRVSISIRSILIGIGSAVVLIMGFVIIYLAASSALTQDLAKRAGKITFLYSFILCTVFVGLTILFAFLINRSVG